MPDLADCRGDIAPGPGDGVVDAADLAAVLAAWGPCDASCPADIVLDVACGPGTNAPHFRHCDYLGLDINPEYTRRATARYGMRFVRDESPYWFPYNCNDAIAEWLRDLGCEVSWALVRVGLELVE